MNQSSTSEDVCLPQLPAQALLLSLLLSSYFKGQ